VTATAPAGAAHAFDHRTVGGDGRIERLAISYR
jgi:hypothetical protein